MKAFIIKALVSSLSKINIKKILAIVCSLFLFIFLIPLIFFQTVIPSTGDNTISEYKEVAESGDLDWSELVVYDTIRYENNFENVNPQHTAFEFFSIHYQEYKDVVYYTTDAKGNTIAYVQKVLVRDVTAKGYEPILNLLVSIGYNVNDSNMTLKKVIPFLEGLNSNYIVITITKLSLDDLIDNFDDDKKQWAFNLLEAVPHLYGDVKEVKDYYLPAGDSSFISPVTRKMYITSPFGLRTHPVSGKVNSMHFGIDLAVNGCYGDPVVAIADGVITEVTYSSPINGNFVRVSHLVNGDQWQTRYCHLSVIKVKKGDKVTQGQTLGQIGSTGRSTGPHLHFELKYKGGYVDPAKYVLK